MSLASYEKFPRADPNFPITFHSDHSSAVWETGFYAHWHEHIEILYLTGGAATVTINHTQLRVVQGDIVVFSSNAMHAMTTKEPGCRYHCLILNKLFCDSALASVSDLEFCNCVRDKQVSEVFLEIEKEMSGKEEHYKAAVKAQATLLLVLLSRKFCAAARAVSALNESQKLLMVKKAISYITTNYQESLTIDALADYVGFSKYYFCHSFKEITGQTVLDYINTLRCTHAKKLLSAGQHNISQSAFSSGFHSLSYFSKTYKKHMGVLPSQDIGAG